MKLFERVGSRIGKVVEETGERVVREISHVHPHLKLSTPLPKLRTLPWRRPFERVITKAKNIVHRVGRVVEKLRNFFPRIRGAFSRVRRAVRLRHVALFGGGVAAGLLTKGGAGKAAERVVEKAAEHGAEHSISKAIIKSSALRTAGKVVALGAGAGLGSYLVGYGAAKGMEEVADAVEEAKSKGVNPLTAMIFPYLPLIAVGLIALGIVIVLKR